MSEFEGTARPYNEAKIQGNIDSQSAQESPREGRQNLGQRKSLKALMEEGMSLLKGTDRREIRRLSRPINLHDTPFEKMLRSSMEEIVESIASADTIESMEFLEEMRERNLQENEIKEQTAVSLTREQQERFRIAENMIALALLKTMPSKVTFVEQYVNGQDRDMLTQRTPELMNPIIRRLEQRPIRRAKAEAAMQRIYEHRGEVYPGKPPIVFKRDALRILFPSKFPSE